MNGAEIASDNFGRKAPCSWSDFKATMELVIVQQSGFSILQHGARDSF